jgi:ABC-2 type transport system ATP-binding protein
VAATLRAHAASGRTLFLSIHQIGDAARVCDRFVLLSAGRVVGEGTADELLAAAASRGRAPESRDLEGAFLALT